ncbi:PHP domain-containing protein [Clostridium botulinum]|uniref:PHP domain-containing protein n=1 Tax=Clostridium botulinum TaxID=1491 RepID=UPI000170FAE2|nr:PHP domain-containing protein [Clostridium botulinum]MBD5563381.1 PHP domain-containing protein [Clostridium botulinum]MBD5567043.1 PHP domain-containing protein [Clostridium botulinum]MBD5570344.1 PHP domain-containing protein [Clostridium botulinum]MBD5573942.1 PHP domain-containing protein [Clostridium botulinum]MBD5577710.1 PHP domain-containing protein [Clostridium botulinum]
MYIKGDFHTHTSASDGKYSSKELIYLAKKEGLDIISITDHDTTDGIEEALFYGKKLNIKVIPGIELSTTYNNCSIHVLGYFKGNNYKNNLIQSFQKHKKEYRKRRANEIVDKLKKHFNIIISFDEIMDSTKGVISRPHIAKAIVEAGYDYSWDYIFSNFIGEGCKAYVPNKTISTEEGISLLKESGAISVLAHPVLIKKTNVEDLFKLDFHGVEAIYYMNKPEDTTRFKNLAKKYNKIITGGSDFHGLTKTDGSHPDRIGATTLDQDNIEKLLKSINSI